MSDNPYQPPETTDIPELTDDVRNWAMLCHLIALLAMPLVGFGNIVGPLVVWLIKRDEHPFIDQQGKESLNFQISITIYTMILIPTVCVGVGIVLLPALWIANAVFIVIASISASRGVAYRYPLNIRLVS